jgi:hypothetical protein
MNWQGIHKRLNHDYWLLLPILALAFYLAFIPHSNYPYLVHLDEWVHLACSNQIIVQGTTVGLVDPFSGGPPITNQSFELGFHLFWAVFQQISGLSWLTIYKYFPAIIFIFTVLSVYIFARRQGFGLEAAFFATLIPTTVGILGPGFLVPVAMGLLFIPLFLFIAFNLRSWWSYLVLFALMAFLLSLHGATAVAVGIILAPYILFNLKADFRHSLLTMLTLVMPFLVLFPWIIKLLLSNLKELLVRQPDVMGGVVQVPRVIELYGYLPISLALLGTFLLAIRGGKKNYGLILGILALTLMLVIYFTFNYGVGILYFRGLMFMMLMLSIIAGAGLKQIRNLQLPAKIARRIKPSFVTKNIGNVLCVGLICLILVIGIPARQHLPYYHMIDTEDCEAFIWIKENIGSSYDRAILDPWKGAAFTAITGKNIYSWIGAAPNPSDVEAYDYLQGGSKSTSFLRENGISIVYSQWPVENPDLTEVRKNVYLLK